LYAHWAASTNVWGASNIYFRPDASSVDGSVGSLTFAKSDQSKSGYQGLYFKWGSLIGVSAGATGGEFKDAYLYIPDVSTGQYYKVAVSEVKTSSEKAVLDFYRDAVSGWVGTDASAATDWNLIPCPSNDDNPSLSIGIGSGYYDAGDRQNKSPLTDKSTNDTYKKYKGDICKFLTDTKGTNGSGLTRNWVMPVSNDFGLTDGPLNSGNGYIHTGDGYTYKNENGSTPWGGFADLSADGTGSTATARLTYTTSEKVIFPAAGIRNGGPLSYVGINGNYWSSSVYGASSAYSLGFVSGGVSPNGSNYRTYGFPVRCVQEF
jgi:hypothetical protein